MILETATITTLQNKTKPHYGIKMQLQKEKENIQEIRHKQKEEKYILKSCRIQQILKKTKFLSRAL